MTEPSGSNPEAVAGLAGYPAYKDSGAKVAGRDSGALGGKEARASRSLL